MRGLLLAFIFLLLLIITVFHFGETGKEKISSHKTSAMPQRIVSLAPGITETLYALGLGDRVVGVTRFCNWPPDAKEKPRVAGFREINFEAVSRSGADLVILPEDMQYYRQQLESLGIPVLAFDIRTLAGYRRDILKLGAVCGASAQAEKLAHGFNFSGKNKNAGEEPSVLFVLMNPDECARPIHELTAIGNDGFYNELLKAAGGSNAYKGKLAYPRLSKEAIIRLDPDALIVAAADCTDKAAIEKNWRRLNGLRAIEKGNLLLLTEAGDTIPGPRSLQTLRKMAKVLEGVNASGD